MRRWFKKYEDLTFVDDFMFTKILTNHKNLCIQLLELILQKKIRNIKYLNDQEDIKILYDKKGITLDVYIEDDENTVYNLEMQTTLSKDLPKRSRYYQAMIDLNSLEKGEQYQMLKSSYVIFICLDDPFEDNLPVYTFEHVCRENPETTLNDDETRIFLNASGVTENTPSELKDFLNYLQGSINRDNIFIRDLDEAVTSAREHKEWKVDYMTLELKLQDREQEGYDRGKSEGIVEGKAEGMSDERNRIIAYMLTKGSSIEEISNTIGVSVPDIEQIIAFSSDKK